MGEIIQKAENAMQQLGPQMTRYRALETMDKNTYDPVQELIDITRALKKTRDEDKNMGDVDLETKIHFKLLEYFSAAPKKQLALEVSGQQNIFVAPVSYSHLTVGRDLAPCKPQLIDVTVKQSPLDELMDGKQP